MTQPQVIEKRRLTSPATTPQALAWDSRNKRLWMGSRDLRQIYALDPKNGTVLKEQEAPGIPWAGVALNGELRFTIGEDPDDDRYIYRYTSEAGFSKMFAWVFGSSTRSSLLSRSAWKKSAVGEELMGRDDNHFRSLWRWQNHGRQAAGARTWLAIS